ncbi:hypothetical protein KY358_04850 [Candidatus Woesearchaeota archaeon]|nr:hypothetical protein [Candidatus Woesearchaeota archaeon]
MTLEKRGKTNTSQEVHDFFKKTEQYTKNALSFLLYFKIIEKNENNDEIKISKDIFKRLDGSREKSVFVLKEKIIRFKPYIEYYSFLGVRKKSEESAKLVKKIYDIRQDIKRIISIFNNWSKFFKIKHDPKPTESSDELSNLNKSLNDDLLLQKFLREQFGNHYKDICSDVITDLIEALKDFKKDPSKSVNDAGRALEDFLRLDFAKSINLTNCSGIIQIANELNKHSLSTKKHNGFIAGLGNIRSMGDAHGADKNEGERWAINEHSALFYAVIIIKTIISLLEYQTNKNLIF